MARVVVLLSLFASMLLTPPGVASTRQSGAGAFDGNPATTERVAQSDPVAAAVEVSRVRFPSDGTAPIVVVSRVDAFADSLAGAPLTAEGPLLYAFPNGFPEASLTELRRVAADDATIYMLGGEAAL